MKLYRIWWGDSNDRCEIAQAIATSIEKVESFVEGEFLEGVDPGDIEVEYDEMATIFSIVACSKCEEKSEENCELCGNYMEYIEIEDCEEVKDQSEHSFNMITGESLMWRENAKGDIVKDENWNQGFLDVLKLKGELHI